MPQISKMSENPQEILLRSNLIVLEDHGLDAPTVRLQAYQTIEKTLAESGDIDAETASRLLVECTHDLNEGLKYSANALAVITEIVKKVQTEQCPSAVNLVPSALGILSLLESLSSYKSHKVVMDKLLHLCCDTILSYPSETLIFLVQNNFNKIKELFEQTHLQTHRFVSIIHKLLKTLPPDEKIEFVKREITFWFMRMIPLSMKYVTKSENCTEVIETLETLTEALVQVEYSTHPDWFNVLECLSKPNRYPVIIKSMLEKKNDYWHRLWMIFIRLLKSQITKVCGTNGSPINSMLHAVECAFKMDAVNRCRAFECWKVLIDNFSSETNDLVVHKRVKLLIIPLRSNNTKIEVLAIAKFETWWHLLRKFHLHIDQFADNLLIPFLYFSFGKQSQKDKGQTPPGQLSDKLKDLCVQSFTEIFGHLDCDGCTAIPRLSNKIINTQLLTTHWEDWMYSLKEVLLFLLQSDKVALSIQQLSCIFKSLLATLNELPASNVCRDLVDNVFKILMNSITENIDKPNTSKVILDVVIPTMTDERYKKLLKIKDDKQSRLRNIVCEILDLLLKVTERNNTNDFVRKVKPLVVLWMSESKSSNECVCHFVKKLLIEENSWAMWTLVADAVFDCASKNDPTIMTILLNWPLQAQNLKNIMTTIADVQYSASVWTNLYNTKPKMNEMFFHDELFAMLQNKEIANTAHYFVTTVLLYVLKQKLANNDKAGEVETKLLPIVLEKINNSQHFEKILPILIDTAVLMLNNLIEKEDKNFAVTVITILKSILKLIVAEKPGHGDLTVFIQDLFALVETFYKKEVYSDMKNIILNDLIACYSNFTSQLVEKKMTGNLLKLFLSQSKDSDPESHNKIKSVLGLGQTDHTSYTPIKADEKFVAPEKKPQKKKREPNILNKVVENGEEYVVVKSNWKFNPKKFTENQKEKMKRTREDIPALYQDLSQSQDEFKLSSWKTDSQDTTSSSKSASKTSDNDASSILQNMPSSEVVPKIIENLMSETKDSKEEKTDLKVINSDEVKTISSPVPKPKTPRMALKDRVFRNVRNLMEKSRETNPSESAVVPSTESIVPRTPNNRVMSMMNIVNSASASKAIPEKQQPQKPDGNVKTPTTNQKNISSIVHSAPAVLPVERPSRIKRKPKKFDDVQLIDFKKRRNSTSLKNSQSDSQVENEIIVNQNKTTDIKFNEPSSELVTAKEKPIVDLISDPTVKVNTNVEEIESAVTVTETENINDKVCEVVNVESHNLTDNNVPKTDVESKLSLDECKSLLTPTKNQLKEIDCQSNDEKLTKPMHPSTKKNLEPKQTVSEITENSQDAVASESSQCSQEAGAQEIQDEILQTPKAARNIEKSANSKPSMKKKKSRIEKELAIDMVEGHPYLNTPPEKRVRKKLKEIVTPRRNNTKKLEKTKSETNTPKSERTKNKESTSSSKEEIITVDESQEKANVISMEMPCSEDVIESSQDSTVTTISTKSTKSPKRVPIVALERHRLNNENTQSLLDNFDNALIEHKCTRAKKKNESFNDSVIPCNKTAVQDKTTEVTATMDTEVIEDKDSSDVIIISEDIGPPMTIDTENTCIDLNTEEIANADTQSMDPNILNVPNEDINRNNDATISLNTQDDTTKTFNERLDDEDSVSSPCKDKSKRKQDFLNNTIEISPIKIASPLKEESILSPETSNDYVVIKLSSPVHSNGEPYEKCDSPEIFTEEKLSPDKRDLSPPRESTTVAHSSPSSALSLKKNRPQVRSGGRAAQMLGLCVSDNENSINLKKPAELEESKKSTTSTPARRNLRMIYNLGADNTEESVDESDDSEHFLKLKKSLPPAGSSPSAPILKRKLAEITDDATVSPVSKRKRVSFHDPPVSTTMSVIKYLEPCCARSPSNSATKRQERQNRSHANMKSPKRLDNVFKLDTILTKAVESFSDNDTSIASTNDTEMSSMEQTPVVEIVINSDLNDTDPICPELVNCKDPISNIAVELSSPSMSSLLTKELEGKVECIGDLAKLTELEVNRLCIKVPKVAIAKKVLTDYLSKSVLVPKDMEIDASIKSKTVQVDSDMQTDIIECTNTEMQTNTIVTATATVQCEACLDSTSTQTDETGSKSTKDAIIDLKEKSDFVNHLTDILDDTTKLQIANTLPFDSISTLLVSKLNTTTSKQLLDSVIQKQTSPNTGNLSFLEDYIVEKFTPKDLIMLCSNLLRKAYDKPL